MPDKQAAHFGPFAYSLLPGEKVYATPSFTPDWWLVALKQYITQPLRVHRGPSDSTYYDLTGLGYVGFPQRGVEKILLESKSSFEEILFTVEASANMVPSIIQPPQYSASPIRRTRGVSFSGWAQGPHAETLRATRVVSANSKSFLKGLHFQMARQAVATTPLEVQMRAFVTTTPFTYHLCRLYLEGNTIGVQASADLAFDDLYLESGAVIDIYTKDLSTAGAVSYSAQIQDTEEEII